MTILVELGAVAVAGVVGWHAARESRREGQARADMAADRLVANAEFGHPAGDAQMTKAQPRKRLGEGPPCHGVLVIHEDGQQACEGGRDDCWPDLRPTYSHRRTGSCRGRSHGCGICQTLGIVPTERHDY